ncbi:MAG: hypothetical protein JWN02_1483 [Acidobacteria bacterium]|nr:hypothetical protein [Acidobacteriota bacterium]
MNLQATPWPSRLSTSLLLLLVLALTPVLQAQCTLTLSDQGTIHLQSGEKRDLTWNSVPGATSYLVEQLIEGLGEPAAPDFALGGPYTESRNGEGRGLTTYPVGHSVLYKITFHYTVTAMKREDPSFQPCKADVRYVVAPDARMADLAARRIVPIAGKVHGLNNSDFSTALIVTGGGLGSHAQPGEEKLYQGRIYFRPLGSRESASDPSVAYNLNGDETVVFDDIMATLGATGVGTIEVVPRIGFPTPLADAIIENRLADGKRTGVRVTAAWGRDYLDPRTGVTVAIRNSTDARMAIGVRAMGAGGGLLQFERKSSDGTALGTVQQRAVPGDATTLIPLESVFPTVASGDRIIVSYLGLGDFGIIGNDTFSAKGVLLFLTETGNDLNNPNIVYRESLSNPHYSQGFDRFIVY